MQKYDHELDMLSENSASLVLRQITAGSKVLELGPATGYMTRYMKEQLNCSVYCIEYDKDSAEQASVYSEKMIISDLEDVFTWNKELSGESFDYILCVDVLEHLKNPLEILKEVVKFLGPDGSVITSIPNVSHNVIVMGLLKGEFNYKPLGLLDNTHIRFFTKESIIEMLNDAGLEILEMKATKARPEDTEFHRSYEEFPEFVQQYLLSNPEGHAYQYISIAKKKASDRVRARNTGALFPISTIDPTYNQLQIFWSEDGQFTEESSTQCYLNYDDEYHIYKLDIPALKVNKIRIDPGSWSGFIRIKSIKLINKNHSGTMCTIQESSSLNDWAELSEGNNVSLIKKDEVFEVFASNKDPQLIWDIVAESKDANLEIWIELSASKGNYADQVSAFILNSNLSIKALEEQLLHLQKSHEEMYSRIEKKHSSLEEQHRSLEEQHKSLEEQHRSLKEKYVMSTSQLEYERMENKSLLEEIDRISEQFNDKTQEHEQLNNVLAEMKSSRSWRITRPLRYIGSKVRGIKRKLSKFLALIFKYPFKMNLIPMQNVISKEKDQWEAVSHDPAFILDGKFPTGWVVMKLLTSSEVNLPLKIYWDQGHGMSEQDSSVVGVLVRGQHVEQKFKVLIPNDTISLRIDPGEETVKFLMKDLRLVKISKYHVFIDALRDYTRVRGGVIRSILPLSRKVIQVLKNSGLSGVKNQTKRVLGLSEIGDLTQNYQQWVDSRTLTKSRIKEIKKEVEHFTYKPLISIIVPVYNVEEKWLRKCIDSVRNQLYPHWELCIADDASPKKHIKALLEEYKLIDPRIKVVYRKQNGHISECSNSALEIASGEFIGLLDHDDELSIDALYENVKLLNKHPDADLIYSDEDKISVEGERHSPFFKPDWSPDLLLSQMYICHFGVYRKNLVDQIGGFRKGYEGSQDYDLALRFTEKTAAIYHIPKILYHWRTIPESTASGAQAKNYTHYAGLKALQDALKRRELDAAVKEIGDYSNMFRVTYRVKEEPLVSIIIPTRNMGEVLDKCLDSIFSRTLYSNFEILIIDNGSTEEQTLAIFKKWSDKFSEKVRILRIDIPFNYSILNNRAVQEARGEYILLLNNDIEVISENWLEEMLGHAQRKKIGAVGAKLLYPDDTIQHAGVVMGLGGIAGHSFRTYHKSDPGYFGALLVNRNCSVVTAACLLIKKEVYLEVGGLEEELTVAFNDVDLCLKLLEKGYINICLNSIELYHHESKSRGAEDTREKQARFQGEINYMSKKWHRYIQRDPYYNINLSLESDQSYRLRND